MANFNEVKEALEFGLNSMTAEEWQNEIIEVIREMAATSEPQISSTRTYWLTVLYEIFGNLKKAGL